MKIRIRGNSIRFRLTKSEVDEFCKTGSFMETTDFGDTVFIYQVKSKRELSSMEASYKNNMITVYLPEYDTEVWGKTEGVGFSGSMELPNGNKLSLLLEKNFVCLDETVEDQSDNYPNPRNNTDQ